MRLNAYLARAGVASRRAADELIKAGRVRVNGEPGELNTFVGSGDAVEVDGRPVGKQRLAYLLLNKPAGVFTTARDPQGRPTVVGLVPAEPRVVPVGRLDTDTTGALVLTDDGPTAPARVRKLGRGRNELTIHEGAQAPGQTDVRGGGPSRAAPAPQSLRGPGRARARAGRVTPADARGGGGPPAAGRPLSDLGPVEAHSLVHRRQRRLGRGPRLLGAERERLLELVLVGTQLLVPRPNRLQQRHGRLGDFLLEAAVPLSSVARLYRLGLLAGRDRHDLEQVRDPRLVRRPADLRARVGDGGLELLADHVGRVGDQHRALRGSTGGGHLVPGLLEVHDPAAHRRGLDCGQRERLAVAGVEPLGDVAGELDVLALVVADRDDVGLVEQDVARLEHRVGEQRGRDELLLVRLLLELRHPAQLAEAGHRRQQPIRLGVRGHVALDEYRRAAGVEAAREQQRGRVERRPAQLLRVVGDRDRVQIDDAEVGLAALLRRDVLAEATGVVAEVLLPRGLDAGKDLHGRSILLLRGTKKASEEACEGRSGCTRSVRAHAPAAPRAPRPVPIRDGDHLVA